MPYHYLDDIATADVCFRAEAKTKEEMFAAACDATVNIMVERLEDIGDVVGKKIVVEEDTIEMLLFELLQALIYYKDTEHVLLRVADITITEHSRRLTCRAQCYGETIDPGRHRLSTDIKAVTMHSFKVEGGPSGWSATVVVDV